MKYSRHIRAALTLALALPLGSIAGCSREQSSVPSEKVQALTETEKRVLSFEQVSDWAVWSGSGAIENDEKRSEGAYSIAVSGIGYAGIRNVVPITKDEHPAPAVVGYDVWIPPNQVNEWWHGDTQLYIEAPSAGVWGQYLGHRSFNDLPKGEFTRVEFPLPDWIREALDNADYDDLRITVAINAEPGSATHFLDGFVLGPDPGVENCTPVDDGNPCTADDCDPSTGQTTHVPLAPGALCSDGNDCNGIEACDGAGSCDSNEPNFDDDNPCTVDSCDPQTGIGHTPAVAGTDCSDGDICNGSETCDASGACLSGQALNVEDENPCTADSCDPMAGEIHEPLAAGTACDDGNVCNGEEFCSADAECLAGIAVEVDDENPCTVDACDATAGVSHVPLAPGTSCDDGDVCNGESLCDESASCVAGTPPNVDDNNPCTADSCDPVAGVLHVSVAAGVSCGDGNACNGQEVCNGVGVCSMGPAPDTDDGNPCTADSCDPVSGVVNTPVAAGTSCSDADACNGEETCNGLGSCVGGAIPEVDDGNPCTNDSCDALFGVIHAPVDEGTSCDDGNACNGLSACDASGACIAGEVPEVDDENPCTADSCDPVTGVTNTPVSQGLSCSDGNACNGEEFCDASGACQNGGGPEVDDGNPCTIDSCDADGGVTHVPAPAGTSCGDANACNGAELCDGEGVCVAGTPIEVPEPVGCVVYSCDPAQGIVSSNAPVGTSCADANLCNGEELCAIGGVCANGTPIEPIDDANPCTVGSCDPVLGLVQLPIAAGTSCDDGDACNGAESCDGSGTCQQGTPVVVDDGNACTIGSCDPETGAVSQVPAPLNSPCGDDDICNGLELCDSSGVCISGDPLNFDDGNACTVDSCDPLFGVDNSPAPAGASCADDNACNGIETCDGAGVCESGAAIDVDDGNACTVGTCDSSTGAVSQVPAPIGTLCDDGDPCNGVSVCGAAGNCVAGDVPTLDDGNPCTIDTCDPVVGVQHVPATEGTLCDDGDPCTGVDSCDGQGLCVSNADSYVDDGNPCTVDICDSEGGVTHEFVSEGTPCSDADACNGLELCDGSGVCQAGVAPLEDDRNPCTSDWCDPDTGVHNEPLPKGASCTLGACMGTGACTDAGICEREGLPVEPDDDPCTLQFCDEETGAVSVVSCTENNPNILTTPGRSMRFLYEGENPAQRAVQEGIFDETTASIIRGKVIWEDGEGVPNARVSILGRPELGWTYSQIAGEFVMVIPGGGELTLEVRRPEAPNSFRTFRIGQREELLLEDQMLVQRDIKSNRVVMDHAEGQWAVSSSNQDDDGERTQRVYFPPGTKAVLRMPNGDAVDAPMLTVRSTEYTVGDAGPERMPASLPPAIVYTYALELTADEAIAAGTDVIEFDRQVFSYTDNFLDFPIGITIPVGFVDYATGKWVASKNGSLLRLEDVVDGKAVLAGLETMLPGDEPSDEELRHLADAYEPGAEFWRYPLQHFSRWDCNMGFFPPDDTEDPDVEPGRRGLRGGDVACGSRIHLGDGSVTHDLPLAGTSQQLHQRGPSSERSIQIQVSGNQIPESVTRIEAHMKIAGQHIVESFPDEPNQDFLFTWDGFDAMGRPVYGNSLLKVEIRYYYPPTSRSTSSFGSSSSSSRGGSAVYIMPVTREELYTVTEWETSLRAESPSVIAAATVSEHHFYDYGGSLLQRGDGSERRAEHIGHIAELFAGHDGPNPSNPLTLDDATPGGLALQTQVVLPSSHGFAQHLAAGPESHVHAILNYTLPVPGQPGTSGPVGHWVEFSPEGRVVSATPLRVESQQSTAVTVGHPILSGDGRRFFLARSASRGRVFELFPDGSFKPLLDDDNSVVAGVSSTSGQTLYLSVRSGSYRKIVEFDVSGAPCIDLHADEEARRVCEQGRLTDVFGGDDTASQGGGCPVNPDTQDAPRPYSSLAVGPEGTLYFVVQHSSPYGDEADFLCSFSPGGIVRALTSNSTPRIAVGPQGVVGFDENPAMAYAFTGVQFEPLAFSEDGPTDKVTALAITPRIGLSNNLSISTGRSVAAAPDGSYYFATQHGIWRVRYSLPSYGTGNAVVSEDGSEFYVFSFDGRHQETRSLATGDLIRSFQYDGEMNLISMNEFDAEGAVIGAMEVERDSEGNPTALMVDEDGGGPASALAHELEFNEVGRLTRVTNPIGDSHVFEYEDPNPVLVTKLTLPNGTAKSYEYNTDGRIDLQTDPPSPGGGAGTFSFTYSEPTDELLKATRRTTPSGLTTVHGREFDISTGEQRAREYPDGSSDYITRDLQGRVESVSRDGTMVRSLWVPDPVAPTRTYESERVVILPVSGLRTKSTHKRSKVGEITGEIASIADEYCVEDAGLQCTQQFYDVEEGTQTLTTPEGRAVTTEVNSLGWPTRIESFGRPQLDFRYDGGHLTQMRIDPDGTEENGRERTATFHYSATSGQLTRATGPDGSYVEYSNFDEMNRPRNQTLGDGATVHVSYDEDGNLAELTPPGRLPHTMSYGPRGRLESYVSPEGETMTRRFDADRRLSSIDYGRDSLGQEHRLDLVYNVTTGELSSYGMPSGVVDFEFDRGQLTSVTATASQGSILTSLDHDGALPTSLAWQGVVAGEVNWTYSSRLQVATETIGALPNTTVVYDYDRDGLVTQAGPLALERDPSTGRVVSTTVAGIHEALEYNDFGVLARQTVTRMNPSTGAELEMLYDVIYDDEGENGERDTLGRILRKSEWIVEGDAPGDSPRELSKLSFDYDYNDSGRGWLESVRVDGSERASYGYDSNGNRLSSSASWGELGFSNEFDSPIREEDVEYDLADRMLAYGGWEYTWDVKGSLESKRELATDKVTFYDYDVTGQLRSVDLPDGRSVQFEIDGFGRRVARREFDNQGNEIDFRGLVYRDTLRPIAEVDSSGFPVARYIYSQDGGRNAPEIIDHLDAQGQVVARYRLIFDQVGSVILVVDADTGEVAQRRRYGAFGELLFDSNPGFQPFGFAGGITDSAIGLVRFGARDYDPSVGRWTAKDPILFGGGQTNLYVYVGNDPVNLTDPEGLFVPLVIAGVYFSAEAVAVTAVAAVALQQAWVHAGVGDALGDLLSLAKGRIREGDLQPNKWLEAGADIPYEDAVDAVKHGGDVLAPDYGTARRIAKDAGTCEPTRHGRKGRRKPHFHPNSPDKGPGHVFY